MELTLEQKQAHDNVIDWFKSGNKLLTLGGLAGTGKTTTLGQIALSIKKENKRIAFCTLSGKASTVLKSKLEGCLTEEDYCGTIHSLAYRLIDKEKLKSGRTELYFSHSASGLRLIYDLIVIDEASMVPEYMFKDLASHGIPILACGDHGQLPPIKSSFNLMSDPEIRLEKIIRQAEGNPIVKMAMMARLEGKIPYGDYGQGCIKTRDVKVLHDHNYADINSIMLCGINKTRVRMNSFAREILKRNDPSLEMNRPIIGEPVICLYNNHKKMIYNGNIGVLESIEDGSYIDNNDEMKDCYDVDINMGDFIFSNGIEMSQFGKEYTNVDEKIEELDYFDFAYCITTHKSQGSEFKNVLLMEEGEWMFKGDIWNKWLYTSVTRSKERLIIYKR